MATHKPLNCSRVRRDITYPGLELNQGHSCSNVLVLGVVAPGLCAHLQPCIPRSHLHVLPLQQHCHKPTSHLCQMCCFTAFSFEAPCACALTSRAVTGACSVPWSNISYLCSVYMSSAPPPPVCLRALSCLSVHRALFVQLLSSETWMFRSQDPSPFPASLHPTPTPSASSRAIDATQGPHLEICGLEYSFVS